MTSKSGQIGKIREESETLEKKVKFKDLLRKLKTHKSSFKNGLTFVSHLDTISKSIRKIQFYSIFENSQLGFVTLLDHCVV